MLKFLSLFMIIPVLFCSRINVTTDLFEGAKNVEISFDNEIVEISKTEFDEFENIFCETIKDAHQLPAISISLDSETKEAMKEGLWIKFIFDKTQVKSEMPFDELLIKLEKDSFGFNIIRGNDGVYEGRCFYLDLQKDCNKLYDFLYNLTLKTESESEVELESQEIKETTIVSEEGETDEDKNKNRKNSVIELAPETDKTEDQQTSIFTDCKNCPDNSDLQDGQVGEQDEILKSQKQLLEQLD